MLNDSFNNGGIGIVIICILLFSLSFWSKISKKIRIIGLIGIFLLIFGTSTFPWAIFQHTPINIIQFPHRIFTISVIFLTFNLYYDL